MNSFDPVKINFCIFHSTVKILQDQNHLVNVAQVRGYIDQEKIQISYNQISVSSNNINTVGDGKTIADIIDFDHIVQLINNYYNKVDLLYNIPLDEDYIEVCNEIDTIYGRQLNKDCVLFSCYRPFLFPCLYAAMIVKRNNPTIDTMIGGPHIELSIRLRELFSAIDVFDYVVKGDIENVVEKYIDGELSKDTHVVEYMDMKKLTIPKYLMPEIVTKPNLYFSTSRGCPLHCSYCPGGHRRLNAMPVENIIDIFKYYNKLMNKVLWQKKRVCMFFTDNTTNFTRKRMEDIADGLIEINNGLKADAFFTFKNLDFELLRKLAKANFATIKLGIDTYNEQKNELYNNQIKYSKEVIYPIIDKIKDLGMGLYGKPGIFGMPGESREMFEEELIFLDNFNKRYEGIKGFLILPYMFYFIPGTPIYNDPSKWDITYEYWGNLNCVISEVNEIAKRTPRYYFCDVTQDEYIYRYTKLRELSPRFRCAEVENFMIRNGYDIEKTVGC